MVTGREIEARKLVEAFIQDSRKIESPIGISRRLELLCKPCLDRHDPRYVEAEKGDEWDHKSHAHPSEATAIGDSAEHELIEDELRLSSKHRGSGPVEVKQQDRCRPLREVRVFPNLPLPLFCFSAVTTRLYFLFLASSLALSLVEERVLKL